MPVEVSEDMWKLGSITFDDTDWNVPVEVGIRAYDDISREDPAIAVAFVCGNPDVCGQRNDDPTDDIPDNTTSSYLVPESPLEASLLDIEVIDDDRRRRAD